MNKIFKSFTYAFSGIKFCFKNEQNFRIHLVLFVLVITLGFVFSISTIQWMIVLLCIGLVLSAEAFNTAIENLCNLIDKNSNPQIKIIKDVAAAATLIVALVSAIIGCIIFLPKLF